MNDLIFPSDWDREREKFEKARAALLARTSDVCPFCLETVSGMDKPREYVRALPCYHTIIKGEIPEVWKPKEEPGDDPETERFE
jgi:hypothetical protein